MEKISLVGVVLFRNGHEEDDPKLLITKERTVNFLPNFYGSFLTEIEERDREVHELLIQGQGEIVPDMLERITAFRLLYERGFFKKKKVRLDRKETFKTGIQKIDPIYLNLILQSFFLCRKQITTHQGYEYLINYFILIQSPPYNLGFLTHFLKNHKLIKAQKLLKKYEKMELLVEPFIIELLKFKRENEVSFLEAVRAKKIVFTTNPIEQYEILPHVCRFNIVFPSFPNLHSTNCYVIGNNKKYVIDPGASNEKYLTYLLKYLDRHKRQLEGILISHEHSEHSNYAQFLKQRYNIPIFASKQAIKTLEPGITVNGYLKDQQIINLGHYKHLKDKKWTLKIIEMKGHTNGSIGFYDNRRIMFPGDALLRELKGVVDPYRGSLDEYEKSLKKIHQYKPKFILPGHGDVITKISKEIRQDRNCIKKRKKLLVRCIKEGNSHPTEIDQQLKSYLDGEYKRLTRLIRHVYLQNLVENKEVHRRGENYYLK